jgi:hypothetical protein
LEFLISIATKYAAGHIEKDNLDKHRDQELISVGKAVPKSAGCRTGMKRPAAAIAEDKATARYFAQHARKLRSFGGPYAPHTELPEPARIKFTMVFVAHMGADICIVIQSGQDLWRSVLGPSGGGASRALQQIATPAYIVQVFVP